MSRYLLAAALVLGWTSTGMTAEDRKDAEKIVLDKQFLIETAVCSHAEVMYSNLAAKRAGSEKVKDLARKIAKEHQSFKEDLALLAEKHKLALAVGTEKKTKGETSRLAKLEGSEFDRAYLKRIIKDHEEGVRMFEAQVKQGEDESMSAFAKKALPRLKSHLKEARALAASLEDNK